MCVDRETQETNARQSIFSYIIGWQSNDINEYLDRLEAVTLCMHVYESSVRTYIRTVYSYICFTIHAYDAYPTMVAKIFRRNQMQLSMYDGTINIEDMIPNWILDSVRYMCTRTSAFSARALHERAICALAYTSAWAWNAMNNAFIVRASRAAQLGSWDFFSDDEKGRTEGRVQRFGISTFYADSALVNPCRWLRILKKRIAALRCHLKRTAASTRSRFIKINGVFVKM